VAVRDGGRADGELSPDGADAALVVAAACAPAEVGDVLAADATVPRSSLANCSLALGFVAGAAPPLPLPLTPLAVTSSGAEPSSSLLAW